MIYLKTDEEIELMFHANQLVGMTLGELAKHVAPGVSTLDLDKIAEEFIRDHGAVPAFLGYGGFPNSICASINEQVVHGIPSSKAILKEGDIISVRGKGRFIFDGVSHQTKKGRCSVRILRYV